MARFDFSTLAISGQTSGSFKAGETIFSAGDEGTAMYVVKSGTVEIRVSGKAFDSVKPGGVFGEMALIDRAPRSADAVAGTDCEVVEVDEKLFGFLVSEAPFFALEVMRVMADRLRRMNKAG